MSVVDLPLKPRRRRMSASSFPVRSASPRALAIASLLAAAATALALPGSAIVPAGAPDGATGAGGAPRAAAAALPALIVPNAGQATPGVRFEAHGAGGTLLFRDGEVVLAGTGTRLRFAGASPQARPSGMDRRPGVVNVLRGDRARWRTHLPTYSGVAYRGLYPGVDARFAGGAATWRVAAGADPARIAWTYPGATGVRVRGGDGALEIVRRGADGTRIRTQAPPVAWQRVGGERVPVPARYRTDASGRVRFAVGRRDPRLPLTVAAGAAAVAAPARAQAPPAVAFSTFLGGIQWDEAMDVETDAAGATYVAGFTESVDARTIRAVRRRHRGIMDAYIAKLGPDGRTLAYATFLGGADLDVANALAVDRAGNAYVAGRTGSSDFPTRRALQSGLSGRRCQREPRHDEGEPCHDAFVAKLSPAGTLVYSTYLGGSRNEEAIGLAVDRRGRAFVAGNSDSLDLPTRRALQPRFRSSHCSSTVPCPPDAFVAKLSADGRALVYATYLGGTKGDTAAGIAVDRAGAAYVAGVTRSADFPIGERARAR
jgi:hypothetical protein